jgi:hypothetical protein
MKNIEHLCYVVLVLPATASRWSETYGGQVPFAVTIFADSVFVLSGTALVCWRHVTCSDTEIP